MMDRFLNWLSPRRAAETALLIEEANAAREMLAHFRGSRFDPIDADAPQMLGGAADAYTESAQDRRRMVDRARLKERNSVFAEAMLTASTNNVVGTGYRLQMLSESETWNEEKEGEFHEWADKADVRGMMNFAEILRVCLRSYLRDGDFGIFLRDDDDTVRLVESDEISTPDGGAMHDPNKVDGIDLNSDGRPVTFHVIRTPRVMWDRRASTDQILVPAEQMLFWSRTQRMGQTRGIPALATIAWILDQIDGQIEAITAAARMAACFGLIIKRQERFSSAPAGKRRQLNLRPGGIFEMDTTDAIEQIEPKHPTTNFAEFIRLLIRFAALPFGLPLETALKDFSQTNYSNARASNLEAWQGWRILQNGLSGKICTPLMLWQLKKKTATRERLPKNAYRHSWQMPGWQWVDPEKEIQAAMMSVDAGFDTITDITARMGRDFAEILKTRKAENEKIKAAGLDLSRSVQTRDPLPEGAKAAAPGAPGAAPAKPGAKPEDKP